MQDTTFLCTYYAQPEFLKICLDSIRKYYPTEPIIVSQEENDPVIDRPDNNIVAPYNIRRIPHTMKHGGYTWLDVAKNLAKECKTNIAVYIEHDAFLLRNINDMLDKIRSGEYDAVGVEEVIPSPGLNRNSPGMMNQNFFIINMKKMKEIGLDKMRLDQSKIKTPIKNMELGYGISQSLEKKLFLPVKDSGYACGTFYGNIVHHFWYGSYPKRNIEYDNINRLWIEEEAERLIKDYWDNKINESNI